MSHDPGALVSLLGANALVTGAHGGIGTHVVRLLRDAGARVLATDLAGSGPDDEADFLPCDLSEGARVAELAERVKSETGGLDVLVHAAGIVRDAVVWKMDPEDWAAVMRTNLDSAFHLLHSFAPMLRESEAGAAVLIGSINGERGKFGQANYAASKAGLIALARTAARELGKFGVRVNVVAPGLIRTPMTDGLPEEVTHRAAEESALGRIGEPEDVARAVLFLCTPLSGHVTGQVLRVDGGQLMA